MPDFVIGQGDTAPPLQRYLVDAAGAAVDIQGATIAFTLSPIRGGAPVINALPAVNLQVGNGSDGSKGSVAFGQGASPWNGGTQTNTAGDFLGRFRVTYSGGAVEWFPNDGCLLVTITPKPGDAITAYVGIEELKKTTGLTGITSQDEDVKRALAGVTRAIDNYCGRTFQLSGADETRKYVPTGADWVVIHDLQAAPTSITFDTVLAVVDTDYYLEPAPVAYPGPPYVTIRKLLGIWPKTGARGCVVVGKFGWPAVPEPVTLAAGIIASRMIRRARDAPFGILPFGDQGEAMRITRADPDVAFLLDPYKRRDL
jgi:hypothetical protein